MIRECAFRTSSWPLPAADCGPTQPDSDSALSWAGVVGNRQEPDPAKISGRTTEPVPDFKLALREYRSKCSRMTLD